MSKKNLALSNDILNEQEKNIYHHWMTDIENNPSFDYSKFDPPKEELLYKAKEFFHSVLDSLNTPEVQKISLETMEPMIQLWHSLLSQQRHRGLSTKDTAMLIFSLKSTLLKLIESSKKDNHRHENLNRLNQLLDIFGLLTFETYSQEKEAVIEQKNEQLHYLLKNQFDAGSQFISSSPQMKGVYQAIGLVLENDITVLLEGETGTGKDLLATLIHSNSKRKNAPFITINCGAIPKELIESELFGHEKGSFTGATEKRLGKFELAQDGTIFLDEIGELGLDMQVKLLRVLQNKEIERVGGCEKIPVNVRVIAATNKNLKQEVDQHRFRLDLYYRIHVFPIHIPPLRERKEDIIPLAHFFISKYGPAYNPKVKNISADALDYLKAQPWEGNIRELENAMQRALLLATDDTVNLASFRPFSGQANTLLLPQTKVPQNLEIEASEIVPLEEIEKRVLLHALQVSRGNIQKAAQKLGISRTTFYNKVKKYELTPHAGGDVRGL